MPRLVAVRHLEGFHRPTLLMNFRRLGDRLSQAQERRLMAATCGIPGCTCGGPNFGRIEGIYWNERTEAWHFDLSE